MLILTRTVGQTVIIGEHIRVTVTRVDRGHVRLGIRAPQDVQIVREELKRPSAKVRR